MSTSAAPTAIAPTTKIQGHEEYSRINPASTSPSPPPTPKTAETTPTATPIFSGGNSSLMIENESGNTAPPAPCTIRHAISTQMFGAKIAAAEPMKKTPRLIRSSRSLPYWSPSFPSSGVSTDAESRNPVSSHVAHPVVVSNSRCSTGSAGRIIVCCSANAMPASVRTASVMLWCWRSGSTSARYTRAPGSPGVGEAMGGLRTSSGRRSGSASEKSRRSQASPGSGSSSPSNRRSERLETRRRGQRRCQLGRELLELGALGDVHAAVQLDHERAFGQQPLVRRFDQPPVVLEPVAGSEHGRHRLAREIRVEGGVRERQIGQVRDDHVE